MINIKTYLDENIKNAVKATYALELDKVFLEHPDNKKWGDYATNIAMELAPKLKQNPMSIAKNIVYELEKLPNYCEIDSKNCQIIESIEVVQPGFINFKLSNTWLYNVLFYIHGLKDSYGSMNKVAPKRIALEHSNVNPNKAAHVGHLRNACIGQFIERIYEFLGDKVEVQYYANDLGVQVVTSMMGVDRITDVRPVSYKKYDHYAWDVYSRMETMISQNDDLKKERESLLSKIEDSTTQEYAKQKELSERILVEQIKTFSDLDITYDVIIHERDISALKLWDKAFEKLKQNPNVYLASEGISNGCWLVRTSSANDTSASTNSKKTSDLSIEEDKVIVRSNGVPTYTGRDIAYHMWKYGLLDVDFHYDLVNYNTQDKDLWTTTSALHNSEDAISFSKVDKVYDVIDVKQTYAIDVVKKSLEFLGYKNESDNMIHINYGSVYLSPDTAKTLGIDTSDAKDQYVMSGRKGWGVKIDDFIEMVDSRLVTEHGQFDALRDVRNGAIKFEVLKYNTFQDVVFDLQSALNTKGFSGPYLQYTYARAHSILDKATFAFNNELSTYLMDNFKDITVSEKEAAILKEIYKFPEIVQLAAAEFAPNVLCNYLFELAQAFNSFYNESPILNVSERNVRDFRLIITSSVTIVLSTGLSILGIKAPAKM